MNNKRRLVSVHLSVLLMLIGCSDGSQHQPAAEQNVTNAPVPSDRTVLPVPDPVFPKITELDARNAEAPPPFSVKAPDAAPNVVIVLIDDIGFGAVGRIRWRHPDADVGTPGARWIALQPVPYHGIVLAHPHGNPDRPQSSFGQRGLGHGSSNSISR